MRRLTWFPHALLCADDAQRLGVLVALMLVRQRQPPTNAAVTAELGAAVVSLPSGLLAMIGEAIAKVESRLEARPRLSRRAPLAQAAARTGASVRARGQKPKASRWLRRRVRLMHSSGRSDCRSPWLLLRASA